VLALLAGARSYRGVITFLDQRLAILNATFGTTLKRAPSVNMLRNLLHGLDTEELESPLRRHAAGLVPAAPAGHRPTVALDGKTLKGSSIIWKTARRRRC
jgi:hypothetical protein